MAPPSHRVRRLRLVLRARGVDYAFMLRGELRAALEAELLPAIDAAFAEVAGGATIRLPRLELHLRVASLGELPARLREGLHRALAVHGPTAEHTRAGAAAAEATSTSPARAIPDVVEAVREYLHTGRLPWTLAGLDDESLRAWREGLDAAVVGEALRAAVAPSTPWEGMRAACFRALELVPEARHGDLLHALAIPRNEGTDVFDALERTARDGNDLLVHDRLRVTTVALAARLHGDRGALRSTVSPSPRDAAAPRWTRESIEHAWRHGPSSWTEGDPVAPSPPGPTSAPTSPDSAPSPLARPRRDNETREPSPGTAPSARDDAFGLVVEMAGLVLLHPYLPRFFTRVGVLRAPGAALDDADRARAVALLRLIATGDDGGTEHAATLLKAFAGLDVDAPLAVGAGLTDTRDRVEVDALLDAVIAHWTALKRTSRETLRSTFLARRGMLHRDARGWLLRVEPRPFDVLLSYLPWSFSVVRLPWMREPVFTEWPTR